MCIGQFLGLLGRATPSLLQALQMAEDPHREDKGVLAHQREETALKLEVNR